MYMGGDGLILRNRLMKLQGLARKSEIHSPRQQSGESGRVSYLSSGRRIPSSGDHTPFSYIFNGLGEVHPYYGGKCALLRVYRFKS